MFPFLKICLTAIAVIWLLISEWLVIWLAAVQCKSRNRAAQSPERVFSYSPRGPASFFLYIAQRNFYFCQHIGDSGTSYHAISVKKRGFRWGIVKWSVFLWETLKPQVWIILVNLKYWSKITGNGRAERGTTQKNSERPARTLPLQALTTARTLGVRNFLWIQQWPPHLTWVTD